MSLTENLQKWADLRKQLDDLELSISEEVIALGKTQSYGDVVAEYKKSSTNGKYDYEGMVRELEPDMDLVEQHTIYPEPYIDFKSLAEAAGASADLKERYYSPPVGGTPKVTVKFKK